MSGVRAVAPGRVNLLGDHVDYCGGPVLPVAIDLATTVSGERGGDTVRLTSDAVGGDAVVPLGTTDPAAVPAGWARMVAGVVAEVKPAKGLVGTVTSTLPVGAGLSSSAALQVAVALALGFDGSATDLALACQRAEQAAVGVPCGIMDQLTSAAGVEGAALFVDCATLSVSPRPLPEGWEILVVDSGEPRTLVDSAYTDRRAACELAATLIGPLPRATLADVRGLDDPMLRHRARHVVTECERVRAVAADWSVAGEAMTASHRSLRDDFVVSTFALDDLVEHLASQPGVIGARMTGAGFGGCAVALVHAGAAVDVGARQAWTVVASAGASLA